MSVYSSNIYNFSVYNLGIYGRNLAVVDSQDLYVTAIARLTAAPSMSRCIVMSQMAVSQCALLGSCVTSRQRVFYDMTAATSFISTSGQPAASRVDLAASGGLSRVDSLYGAESEINGGGAVAGSYVAPMFAGASSSVQASAVPLNSEIV